MFLAKWLYRHADILAVKYQMREAAGKLDPRVIARQPEPSERNVLERSEVRDIRKRVSKGESLDSVGADYSRDKSAISLIARGLRYSDVS